MKNVDGILGKTGRTVENQPPRRQNAVTPSQLLPERTVGGHCSSPWLSAPTCSMSKRYITPSPYDACLQTSGEAVRAGHSEKKTSPHTTLVTLIIVSKIHTLTRQPH